MQSYETRFRELIERCTPLLLDLPNDTTATRPAPDKWSRQEILGHLIDSASNNHRRFVEGQFGEDLVFVGYDQEAWVRAQPYQTSSWAELVGLWRSFNLHLLRIVESVPESTRLRPRTRHNLAEIGWKVSPDESTTLDYIMSDYVSHLEHHLRQILGSAVDSVLADPTRTHTRGAV